MRPEVRDQGFDVLDRAHALLAKQRIQIGLRRVEARERGLRAVLVGGLLQEVSCIRRGVGQTSSGGLGRCVGLCLIGNLDAQRSHQDTTSGSDASLDDYSFNKSGSAMGVTGRQRLTGWKPVPRRAHHPLS